VPSGELVDRGTTILVSTHYMDEAQRLCDQVAIITAGRVIASGAPAELITSRLAPETVELDCTPTEEAALLNGVAPERRLRVGRRLMIYVDDATNLIDQVRRHDEGDRRPLIVRPTNLEDVFLSLTGASLEANP